MTRAAAWREDALFLLELDEHPERVARRVGVTVYALERAFRDHPKHSRKVQRVARRAKSQKAIPR